MEGERRAALKMVQYKVEELQHAGYSSEGEDDDWTSLNLEPGDGHGHPPALHPIDPTIVLNTKGTETTDDDLVGAMSWAVQDTHWVYDGPELGNESITVDAKVVVVTLAWPEGEPTDSVSLTTLIVDD